MDYLKYVAFAVNVNITSYLCELSNRMGGLKSKIQLLISRTELPCNLRGLNFLVFSLENENL